MSTTKTDLIEAEVPVVVDQSRRDFMKRSGAGVLSLSLVSLTTGLTPGFVKEALAGTNTPQYQKWEDVYRNVWKWDKVTWGSHLNICWPQGSCKFYIYVRNGIVWREEQAAHNNACSADHVDFKPLGCQKGSSFNNNLYGDERIKYPLKRVGRRGEGKWKRVSWDEAATDVADSIIDSFESQGTTDGFVLDAPHVHAGSIAWGAGFRMTYLMDGVSPDINIDIGDTYMGTYLTFGKMHMGYSADNLLDSELIFMVCSNWSYTYPSSYHFMTEARYKGAEVVVVAPDLNPTTPGADIHVPVKVGRDAAFWLGLCKVMIDEKLINRQFASEQTDLPFLVRTDTGKFLSAAEVEGGFEKQFYFMDEKDGVLRQALRGTLKLEHTPALEGTFDVKLQNGSTVQVQTVFERLKEHLKDYTPEKASAKSGVPPSLIRELGRKLSKKRASCYIGFTSAKSYHGDLFERSLHLAMALSGNWGKPGTGSFAWAYSDDNMVFLGVMDKPVAQGGMAALHQMAEDFHKRTMAADPTATDEMGNIEFYKAVTSAVGLVPPAFWLYYHAGYNQLWDNKAWQDPALKKTFGGYLQEAIDKGWWTKDHLRPAKDNPPQVYMLLSQNPMRRKRSGAKMFPEVLFPKLKMIFALEVRMSSSAMYADIVMPCAWYYEKHEMTTPCSGNPFFTFVDRSVPPPGECKEEWDAIALIFKKIEERAKARGLTEFTDHNGKKRRYDELHSKFTMNGQLLTNEDCLKEMVDINKAVGVFAADYSYEKFKKEGSTRFLSMGAGVSKYAHANEVEPNKPIYPMRWHVEEKKVFPTHTRRAQFYFDHNWYMEAGEALPVHKDPPMLGGDHPFQVTGGHPRVSIHSMHLSNAFLSRLHRGQPVVHINDKDAAALGIKDGEMVKMFNDFADCQIMARVAPIVQPKQCIVYFWEAYQYKDWKPYDIMLIGLPKALHLAGGYEQFRYYFMNGSPAPATDRGVRVSIQKLESHQNA